MTPKKNATKAEKKQTAKAAANFYSKQKTLTNNQGPATKAQDVAAKTEGVKPSIKPTPTKPTIAQPTRNVTPLKPKADAKPVGKTLAAEKILQNLGASSTKAPAAISRGVAAAAKPAGQPSTTLPTFKGPLPPGDTFKPTTSGGSPGIASAIGAIQGLQKSAGQVGGGIKGAMTGGAPTKMKSGGSVGSASKRADGCAIKGKTRGRMI